MLYHDFHGHSLSAFQLGTVQLGMTYGLGEYNAKPSLERAFSVLDAALTGGVNILDTANNYGDSEAVIGKWLTTVPRRSDR